MITDKLENLKNYLGAFPQLKDLVIYLDNNDLNNVKEKLETQNITLIPITSQENKDFDFKLLEAHRTLMDVHITLKGTDKIGYQFLDDKISITKKYDEEHDYLLGKGEKIISLDVPEGYFCVIPNHFAHMALYNNKADIDKIVVKIIA